MEKVNIPQLAKISKQKAIKKIETWLKEIGLDFIKKDLKRPWGAFWYINPQRLNFFLSLFFPEMKKQKNLNLSPKILLICSKHRFSWQWHQRRIEIWRILTPMGIFLGDSDRLPKEEEMKIVDEGELIKIPQEKRHRLVGLKENHGLVAEIWQHTDPLNPSDEEDNTRVHDDYNRS